MLSHASQRLDVQVYSREKQKSEYTWPHVAQSQGCKKTCLHGLKISSEWIFMLKIVRQCHEGPQWPCPQKLILLL